MELHTSFQPEVLNPALGLVGVTGLSSITDKTSNGQDAIEATVWEILSIRKTPTGATRTPPIHFIPLTKNHLFPPKKTKAAPPLPPGRHLYSPPPATGTTATTSGTMYDDPLHAHHHHQVPTTLPPSLLSQSPYQHLHSNSSGSSGSGTPPPASPTGGVPPAITSLLSSSPLGMSHLNASVSSLGAFSSAGSLSQYPGILKANWLPKHFSRQPGLVVSFYHHDQYDPDWRNRDGVIINEILERKRNLQERGIRFIVVLLAIDSKPNADMKVPSNERMSILKNSCGLDKTTLYVYFPSHNIREFLINLEKSLYELLSTHYRDQGKRVRQMLDKLHAPMDFPLIVRYNFKIGAFSELRQDLKTAVKHYSLAYEALLECLPAQSNLKLIEIKCVGEIINYKMCKLLMFGTLPEAFDQFDLHLKSFIPLQGTIELIDFEHWAFVAKQCRAFADMLDVAIRQGHLLKDHNQHPGYYYMMAAKYSVQRKLKRGPPLKTQPENPSVPQMPIYVGQLPPKLDHPLDNPENPFELDQAAEAEFVAVAREKESKIDYSPIIVDHLSKAYEQFKKFKETRMTLHTASQIAQEYYESENYEKALKFFERIAKSYRKDNWNTILRDILLMSFVCAKNLQKTDAAIGYASELISEDLGLEVTQRKEIQRELAVMLKVPSPSIDPQAGPMVLETDQITSFVSCKVQFHKADYSVGEEAWLSLVVSVNCPLPIRFGSIRIFFLPRELSHVFFDHSTELIPSNIKEQQPASSAVDFVDCRGSTWSDSVYQKELDLLFHPKKIRVFEIPLKVKKAREIKCSLISFHLDAGGRQISFQHKIPEDPQFDLGEHRQANVGVLRKAAGSSAWLKKTSIREVKEYPITRIHLRQLRVKLDVSSQGSPVLDEWFPLRVLIFNKENHPIEGLFDVDFRSAETKDLKTFVAMGIADLPGKEKLTDVPIGLIPAGEGKEVVCFVRGHRSPGDRLVKIKVRYHELLEDQTKGEECAVEKEEKLAFGKPFQVGANVARQQIVSSLQAVHFGQVDYASLGREDLFSLAVSIKPSSDAPIVVTDVSLCPVLQESGKGSNPEAILESFDENVTSVKMVSESKDLSPKPWHWTVDEIHKFHFLLKITSKSSTVLMTGILPIGYLQITWRREDVSLPSDGFVATTKVPIVSAEDVKRSLTITTETPSFAQVGEAFPVTYTIGNPSNQVVEASASLESHESFMFSGFRQCSFRLLPFSSHSLTFNCFPTQSGRHSLPLLNLLDKRQDSPLPIGPIVLLVKPPLSVKPQ